MKKINKYGVSRSRDKNGKIVKREFKDYTMCIHAQVGSGRENMWVLIGEVYEEYGTQDDEREDIQDCWKQPEESIQG